MKKTMLCAIMTVMLLTLTACGSPAPKGAITTDVTWDELLAANTAKAVFTQVDSFSATSDAGSDDTYIHYAAMVDGSLIYSTGVPEYTDDMIDGIIYDAPLDGLEKSITILAPNADLYTLLDGAYGEELSEYDAPNEIYRNDGQYFAALYYKDPEWGIVTDGYAYFDADTLLLDRVDVTQHLGALKSRVVSHMTYNTGADFAMTSYDNVVNTEDPVHLTIHYPDGTTKDITVDREVTISAYYPGHEEPWSVCWDADCTARVDHLDWIEGSRGDVYLCKGHVNDAPPLLSRVLEKSSFEVMFRDNYDTYFQTAYRMDLDENVQEVIDLAWYIDEKAGLGLNFEIKDADYNVTHSGRAREGAWYSWNAADGYAVDFYEDFAYAETLVDPYREYIGAEQLAAPFVPGEEGYAYYSPYTKILSDGTIDEYQYWIHPDFDNVDRIEITHKDNAGIITGYTHCYVGGNGPIPGDMDIYTEISAPQDTDTVRLTLKTAHATRSYTVRRDAKIYWQGQHLYTDETYTQPVTDLNWTNDGKATIYAK